MPIPRLKPAFPSIHPTCPSGVRCLRTKPTRLPPRQAAFGLPIPDFKDIKKSIQKGVNKKLRGDDEIPKIPVVPRFDDDGKEIKTKKTAATKIPESKLMEEDIEQEKRLKEQEERLREFERVRKLKEEGGARVVRTQTEEGEVVEEVPDNIVYPRDVVGAKYRKEKVKYKIEVYPTKNYMGFLSVEANKKRLAQAAVEIIQEYQKRMNADKLATLDTTTAQTALPGGIALEGVDTKCLSLPFPVEAILPTTRLIFAELKDQVRFALSDKQINSISTGLDFVRHLLTPPPPPTVSSPNQAFLYNQLTRIPYPPNVRILPDKQLARKQLDAKNAQKSRQAKIEQLRQQAEALVQLKERREEKARLRQEHIFLKRKEKEFAEAEKLEKERAEDMNYSQFYGRPQ